MAKLKRRKTYRMSQAKWSCPIFHFSSAKAFCQRWKMIRSTIALMSEYSHCFFLSFLLLFSFHSFILNVHEFVCNERNIMWMRLNKYDTLWYIAIFWNNTSQSIRFFYVKDNDDDDKCQRMHSNAWCSVGLCFRTNQRFTICKCKSSFYRT